MQDREVEADGFRYVPHYGVFYFGRRLSLTPATSKLVAALMASAGRVITKEGIVAFLGTDAETKIADVYACKARKVIYAETGLEPIRTVWGRGYIWQLPPSE